MVDTHCHLFSQYYSSMDDLISKIKEAGIKKIIVNGCDMDSNIEVLQLVKKYDCVYGALGFHPTELVGMDESYLEWLDMHVMDDKIVAVGEIGLDYHYDDTDKIIQTEYFKKQLSIAEKHNKPVIIHTRDAIQDTYDIVSEYNVVGSVHCFSGSVEMAKQFIKLGFFIGVGGICTYKNAKNILNVIKNIGLEYILLETDSPYLSPEGKRSEINTPCNIPLILKKVADIKEVSESYAEEIISFNVDCLFDF